MIAGEWRATERHLRFGLTSKPAHQQAIAGVARLYGCAAAAAFQRVGIIGEGQPARAFLGTVAGQAACGEDGMDLLVEIDPVGGVERKREKRQEP